MHLPYFAEKVPFGPQLGAPRVRECGRLPYVAGPTGPTYAGAGIWPPRYESMLERAWHPPNKSPIPRIPRNNFIISLSLMFDAFPLLFREGSDVTFWDSERQCALLFLHGEILFGGLWARILQRRFLVAAILKHPVELLFVLGVIHNRQGILLRSVRLHDGRTLLHDLLVASVVNRRRHYRHLFVYRGRGPWHIEGGVVKQPGKHHCDQQEYRHCQSAADAGGARLRDYLRLRRGVNSGLDSGGGRGLSRSRKYRTLCKLPGRLAVFIDQPPLLVGILGNTLPRLVSVYRHGTDPSFCKERYLLRNYFRRHSWVQISALNYASTNLNSL